MYITFNNTSTNSKMTVTLENQKHIIDPGQSANVFCQGEKIEFLVQTNVCDVLSELVDEIDGEEPSESFVDRVFTKVAKKVVKKMPEHILEVLLKYEVRFDNLQNTVVNLYDGMYSESDGGLADIFDLNPTVFVFSRAEVENGQINVVDANPINRKEYLKNTRKLLFWTNQYLFSIDWLLFIPEYAFAKYYSSPKYLKKLFINKSI